MGGFFKAHPTPNLVTQVSPASPCNCSPHHAGTCESANPATLDTGPMQVCFVALLLRGENEAHSKTDKILQLFCCCVSNHESCFVLWRDAGQNDSKYFTLL